MTPPSAGAPHRRRARSGPHGSHRSADPPVSASRCFRPTRRPRPRQSAAGLPPRPSLGQPGVPGTAAHGLAASAGALGNAPALPQPWVRPVTVRSPAGRRRALELRLPARGLGPASGAVAGPPDGRAPRLAAIAVVVLVLASAGVGAAVSSAVHSNNNATAQRLPSATARTAAASASERRQRRERQRPLRQRQLGSGTATGTGNSSGTSRGSHAVERDPLEGRPGRRRHLHDDQLRRQPGRGRRHRHDPHVVGRSPHQQPRDRRRIQHPGPDRRNSGSSHTAHVVGYDVVDDVALLQIDNVSGLKTVSLADSTRQ